MQLDFILSKEEKVFSILTRGGKKFRGKTAIVVEAEKDYGIRFFGIPGGYEFNSLISAIYDVSRKATDLSLESKDRIGKEVMKASK